MMFDIGSEKWKGARAMVDIMSKGINPTYLLMDPAIKDQWDAHGEEWKDGWNTALENAKKEGLVK